MMKIATNRKRKIISFVSDFSIILLQIFALIFSNQNTSYFFFLFQIQKSTDSDFQCIARNRRNSVNSYRKWAANATKAMRNKNLLMQSMSMEKKNYTQPRIIGK